MKNCRVIAGPTAGCVGCQSASAEFRDSHFASSTGPCLIWNPQDTHSLQATNCVWQGDRAAIVLICHGAADAKPSQMTLTRNCFSTRWVAVATLEQSMQHFEVTAQRNACDADLMLMTTRGESIDRVPTIVQMRVCSPIEFALDRVGKRIPDRSIDYLSRGIPTMRQMIMRSRQATLDDWLWLWEQQESGSFETDIRHRIGRSGSGAAIRKSSSSGRVHTQSTWERT